MKKSIVFFVVIVCGCFNSSAQFLFGPMAGLNIATLNGTTLTVTSKPGLHAGIYLNIPFGKHLSLMPAALYSMKGFKYDYTTTSTSSQPDSTGSNTSTVVNLTAGVNATLGYLDIPALLTFWAGEQKGFFIQAGPQFSFLITDNATVNTTATVSVNGGASQPTTPSTLNALGFHKSDIALIGGIGYKFPKLLIVYARASTGFSKVQQDGFAGDANAGYNFVLEAGAALSFGVK